MDYETTGGFSIERDAFLPVLLLGLSVLIFFIWQISGLSTQRTAFKSVIERQDQLVTQSRQLESKLQGLALDLLNTARTDDVARQIVMKYNIQQQQPAPGRL